VVRKGMFWAIGPEIEEFEKLIATYVGRTYAVAFNSGTSALHALLLAYGVRRQDEVIVPSFTFIATANSALFVGAKPVFVDIEEKTFGLDPRQVRDKITAKTKVIMPIHYGGAPCKINELREIAEKYKIVLIEDAAESVGANINGKMVGSFGDSAMISFCGNKVITTGEGGVALTDSKDVYEKLKLIRSHGRLELENYFSSTKDMDYVTLGYNWRMSSITAALGISQMKKLDKIIEMRRKKADYLTRKLSKIDEITPPNLHDGYYHVYQMYTVRVKSGKETRDKLKDCLAKYRIMSKVYFPPAHLFSYYKQNFGFKGGELPMTEKISNEVLTLPMYPSLRRDEMDLIADKISEFFEKE